MGWTRFFRREQSDAELQREIELHVEEEVAENLERGMSEGEARRRARVKFGSVRRVREEVWRQSSFSVVENFFRDVSYSVRRLRRSPGFTAVAVLTLALGVGANTAVFSMINGLLLRPLDVPHADELTVLNFTEGSAPPQYEFNAPYFRALEGRREVFSKVFAYEPEMLQVQGASENEDIAGVLVSGRYFEALETEPLLGRYLTAADDQQGGSPAGYAAVISEGFWERWFGRAQDVVGRKLVIANVPFTVAGVMPRRFIGADPTQRPEIFVPLSADPVIHTPRSFIEMGTHAWWLTVGARRQAGVTLEQANAALETISLPILRATAEAGNIAEGEKGHFHFAAEAGSKGFTYARIQFGKPLVAMGWMCGGVLLLACLNLASLLLARGASRERELATRLAMGGTRGRLIRQLLVESMLIALMGTAVGLAVAPMVSQSLATMLMSGNRMSGDKLWLDTSLDARVFGFAAVIAVVSTMLVGLLPALRATGGSLNEQIKNGQHARQSHQRRGMLPRVLLASEVALALVLVIGAGLLAMSLVKLFAVGVGFEPKGLVNIAFKTDKQPLEGDALMRVYQQMDEALRRQPGVKAVSFEAIVPLSGAGWNGGYSAQGGKTQMLDLNSVGPEYFSTMRIPMDAGREFRWNDTKASGLKIILNEKAAKLLFPGRNAVGQQLTDTHDKSLYEVVAVVGDTRYYSLRRPIPPQGYLPITQDETSKPSLYVVVRTDGPLGPLAETARVLTKRLTPTVPVPVLMKYDDVVNRSISSEWMMALLSVFFAVCALLVTAIGLYGTLAYTTARRTNEIGVRMALGAQRGRVMAMIFRENVIVAALGCGVGLVVALLAGKALASFLYGISVRDPWVLVGSVMALIAIASAASLLPALRAAMLDPQAALRHE